MAIRVPTPPQMQVGAVQEQVTARAFQNVQYRPDTFMGEQLQRLSQGMSALNQRLDQTRTDTALMEAQSAINAKRRELFDPETGIYARKGAAANGVTDYVDQEMQAFTEQLLAGKQLSGSGREAVQRVLEAERQRTYETAAAYEVRANEEYQATLYEAQRQDHLEQLYRNPYDAAGRDSIMTMLVSRAQERAATQQGLDKEALDRFVEADITEGLLAAAAGMAAVDPVLADQFLEENRDAGLAPAIDKARESLKERVVEQRARGLSSTALRADQNYGIKATENVNHGANIKYSMGSLRPNPPSQEVMNLGGTALADVIGPGGTMEITSGQGTGNADSGRHLHGKAMDVKFYRPDGSLIRRGDPEFLQIAVALASRGALGLGAGYGDMGDAMHVDLVTPDPAKKQDHEWGIFNNPAIKAQLDAARDAGVQAIDKTGLQLIMEEEDPDVREAALARYRQEQTATYSQIKRNSELAADTIITQIEQAKASGDKVPPLSEFLTPQALNVLGGNSSAVEAAYNRVVMREEVDPQTASDRMYSLVAMSESASPVDRQDFAEINLNIYRHQLGRDQFDQLRLLQLKARTEFGMDVKGDRVVSNQTGIKVSVFEDRVNASLGNPTNDAERLKRDATVMALLDWANGVKQTTGRDPDEQEIYRKAFEITTTTGAFVDTWAGGDEVKGTLADLFTAARSGKLSIQTMMTAAAGGDFMFPVPDKTGGTLQVPITKAIIDEISLSLLRGEYPGLDVSPASVLTVLSRTPRQVFYNILAEQAQNQ